MKRGVKFNLFAVLISAAMLLYGCTDNSVDPESDADLSVDVESNEGDISGEVVTFTFVVDDLSSATESTSADEASRAIIDKNSSTSQLMDLWFVQYDSSGAYLGSTYYDELIESTADLVVNSSATTFVFIANTFNSDLFTMSELQTEYDDLFDNLIGIIDPTVANSVLMSDGTDQYCLMSAVIENYGSGGGGIVYFRRNCARVNVKINSSYTDFDIISVSTINIPIVSSYLTSLIDTDPSNVYPVMDAPEYVGDYEWTTDDIAAAQTDDGFTLYLPVNQQGENPIVTDSRQKPAGAPGYATAVQILLRCVEGDDYNTWVLYSFYLGANMTNDYNLMANYAYNYTFTIASLGNTFTDSRVEDLSSVYAVCTYEEESVSNCYILNPSDEEQVFYIPIEGRINTYWGGQGYENTPANTLVRGYRGEDWYVDILWSDISGVSSMYSTSVTEPTTSGGFSVERVLTDNTTSIGGTTIAGRTALKVTLPADFNIGNIVIGIRKSSKSSSLNNYLWSWHFWITDYDPDSYTNTPTAASQVETVTGGKVFTYGSNYWSKNNGKWIMDRMIGAISSDNYATTKMVISPGTKGILYYQYGRKDPFTMYCNGGASVSAISYSSNLSTIASAVKSPTYMSTTYNWPSSDSDYKSTSIYWNDPKATNSGTKSIFDPSPLGWKVPASGTWNDFSATSTTWDSTYYGRYYNVTDDVYAYYPLTGYLSTGSISNALYNGYYWTCSPYSDYNGYLLYFNSSSLKNSDNIYRYRGCPIIAIQQ